MANTEPNAQPGADAAPAAIPITYPQDARGVVLTPAHRARRQLLRGAAGAAAVAVAGYFTWTRYLFPSAKPVSAGGPAPPPTGGGTALGLVAAFPTGGPPVLLPHPSADGGVQAKYVVENQGGQFRVLSAVCTHQGCSVGWDAKDPAHFVCPCHGAVYDLTGKNVAGPAPRPLPELPSHVSGGTLFVEG